MAIGLQTSIWENRLKTIYLIVLMFVIVILGVFICFKIIYPKFDEYIYNRLILTYVITIPVIFIWLLIVVNFHKEIVFGITKSKSLERKNCPELYNIVENLCISRGMPMVKIGLIEDDSLNAFSTGWGIKNSYIAFSRGLLAKLKKEEIEAVAAHELAHIINGDTKIMLLATLFVGIVATIGEFIIRNSFHYNEDSQSKSGGNIQIFLIGLVIYIIGIIILPLIKLAVSRSREYLADAGSVELTHDNKALISALQKISNDSIIEKLSNKSLGSMFIYNPNMGLKYDKKGEVIKKPDSGFFGDIFSTHPSIENRVKALENY